jgi:predicted ester cyclase
MVAEGGVVAARMVFSGSHRGEVLGVEATGRRVRYEGIAWFRIEGGLIAEVIVMADREGLLGQLAGDRNQ